MGKKQKEEEGVVKAGMEGVQDSDMGTAWTNALPHTLAQGWVSGGLSSKRFLFYIP